MLDSISDKDFLEDTDSDEEFDKKFQDSIQAHREAGSRPSSSSSRPKTASRYRDDTESRTNLIAATILQVYYRMSRFIQFKKLSKGGLISQFGEYVTAEKLQNTFEELGFELNDAEINFIFRDSGVPRSGVLRMGDIYNKLISEAQEDEEETPKTKKSNTENLRKEAEALLMEPTTSHKKTRKTREKSKGSVKRPSSTSSRTQRPPSAPSSRKSYVGGIFYLKESRKKQAKEKVELEMTVDRCRREFEFDCIQKMGEANDIMQELASEITYRGIRKDDMTLKCHKYVKDKFVEEVSLEKFIREWKRIKNKKPKMLDVSVSQMTSKSISAISAKVNKTERQEELRKLLLETRDLTNSLKKQLRVLEQKGIVRRDGQKDIILMQSRVI